MRLFGRRGQATVEFTVGMVFVIILLIGMIKVFVWTGRDQLRRIAAHEAVLLEDIVPLHVLNGRRAFYVKSVRSFMIQQIFARLLQLIFMATINKRGIKVVSKNS